MTLPFKIIPPYCSYEQGCTFIFVMSQVCHYVWKEEGGHTHLNYDVCECVYVVRGIYATLLYTVCIRTVRRTTVPDTLYGRFHHQETWRSTQYKMYT